jgi:ATP-dependent 26S proteasome regulatory subunit
MPKTPKAKLIAILTDPNAPIPMKMELLREILVTKDGEEVGAKLLQAAAASSVKDQYEQKLRDLNEQLKQLEEGPLRFATFLRMGESTAFGRRAQVILPDGTPAFCTVLDDKMAASMRCGDTVWLEAQGRVVLFHQPDATHVGEVARIERLLDNGDIEVSVGELGRFVYRPSARLADQIEKEEAEPGSSVIVCQRRMMVFASLPSEDGPGHMRFLSKRPVPDIVIGRDIGAPPEYLSWFTDHLRRELTRPDIGSRYGLRRSLMHLLTGVPGCGKSFSIMGFWNRMYEVMSEHTGVPVEDLPQRVMHLSPSSVLSKWLGSSDRNIARFFEEIQQLASEPFEAPDGTVYELPVLVICEEIDALARERGQDGIHDRILVTLLSGLDPEQSLFRDKLVFVVCTTNVPQLLDAAAVRRMGGTVDHFKPMKSRMFRAVLAKQLRKRPFRSEGSRDSDEARRCAVADVAAWLYSPNSGDLGQVELTYAGQTQGVIRRRRDFLTPALVDRAVQQASRTACHAEWIRDDESGITSESLMCAIDEQVRNIVDQLTLHNAHSYLALPDGTRVANVRRIDQPSVLPLQLERAS